MLNKLKEIASTENGVLARLWRNMLLNNNLLTALGWMISNYSKKGDKPTTTVLSLATAGELTWEAFTFLVLEILKPKEAQFGLKVKAVIDDEEKEILASISITPEKKRNILLAKLRDKIFDELGLDKEDVLEEYKKRKKKPKNPSTVKTILYTKNLTWKSLLFILLEVIKAKEIGCIFQLEWNNVSLQETCLLEGKNK